MSHASLSKKEILHLSSHGYVPDVSKPDSLFLGSDSWNSRTFLCKPTATNEKQSTTTKVLPKQVTFLSVTKKKVAINFRIS